jgi:hypothetical protein
MILPRCVGASVNQEFDFTSHPSALLSKSTKRIGAKAVTILSNFTPRLSTSFLKRPEVRIPNARAVPCVHQIIMTRRVSAPASEKSRTDAFRNNADAPQSAIARAVLHETALDMWESVRAESASSKRQVALGRAAAPQTAETAASVTQAANRLAGGGSIFAASPLQRHARNAEALAHHLTVSPQTREDASRLLLGRDTLVPVF